MRFIQRLGYRQIAYQELVKLARLNKDASHAMVEVGVHACMDVTGFGLLGHLLEICRGSGLAAEIEWSKVPVLSGAKHLVEAGFVTGASERNWASYGTHVTMPAGDTTIQRKMLTDPQTSGGLLVACTPDSADEVLALFKREGFAHAAVIGRLAAGAGIQVK